MKTRDKMVQSAALLMRRDGVEATSFSNVLEHSGAPRGSIYHHFPRGKSQLIEEATRWGGDYIAEQLAAASERGGPHAMLEFSEAFWRTVLEQSDFDDGCPIVAATVEGIRNPEVRDAAGRVFAGWEKLVAEELEKHGVAADRAATFSSFSFAAIEGAVILARAQRSFEPIDRTFAELRRSLDDALSRR